MPFAVRSTNKPRARVNDSLDRRLDNGSGKCVICGKPPKNHSPEKEKQCLEYYKATANDDLQPVVAEDPERALALAKHAAGVTKSQDKQKKVKDGEFNAELDQVRMTKEKLKQKIETVEPVGAEFGKATMMPAKLASKVMSLEKQATKNNEIQPVGDSENYTQEDVENYRKKYQEAKARGDVAYMAKWHTLYGMAKAAVSKSASDTELPMPIKTSNLVPLPSGERNEERYAPRPVGDEPKRTDKPATNTTPKYNAEAVQKAINRDPRIKGKEASAIHRLLKGRTGDSVNLNEQRSGSEPADHLYRAAQYEIQGDRARALDSYRAAASGFRNANDRVNEAKARDGVEACQTRFASQYDHPGAGRVKVCDSAEQAVRTAVERTRAGEDVRVDGNKVLPGRARAKDAEDFPHKANCPANNGDACRCGATEAAIRAVRGKDEHEGFEKLEGELSHEKGVKDPAALAASIGRKKYGAAGMAAKGAAGRARDERTVRELRNKLFSIHNQKERASIYFPDEAKGSETVEQMRHRLFKLEPQDGPYSKARDIAAYKKEKAERAKAGRTGDDAPPPEVAKLADEFHTQYEISRQTEAGRPTDKAKKARNRAEQIKRTLRSKGWEVDTLGVRKVKDAEVHPV